MLALLAGMTRTAAAMADDGELTRVFRIRIKNGVPIVAEVVIALFVGIIGTFRKCRSHHRPVLFRRAQLLRDS